MLKNTSDIFVIALWIPTPSILIWSFITVGFFNFTKPFVLALRITTEVPLNKKYIQGIFDFTKAPNKMGIF